MHTFKTFCESNVPTVGDCLVIELGDVSIETEIVDINEEGIVVQVDDVSEQLIGEATYQGREVPLNKPMKGDVKKSKVFVKNAQGNVVKVNFGDKQLSIKKHIPARRKAFRARHNCATAKDKTSARYWSCRAW